MIWAVDSADLAKPAIRALVLDADAVDEINQDVLIAMAESIAGYRGDARFTTWLHRVARNKGIDHLRRRHRRLSNETVGIDDDIGRAARISSMIVTRTALRSVIESWSRATATPSSCATSSTSRTRRSPSAWTST